MCPKACASPSPYGIRWPEGPDEGRSFALTRRFAAPSPRGRGTSRKPCSAWISSNSQNGFGQVCLTGGVALFKQGSFFDRCLSGELRPPYACAAARVLPQFFFAVQLAQRPRHHLEIVIAEVFRDLLVILRFSINQCVNFHREIGDCLFVVATSRR